MKKIFTLGLLATMGLSAMAFTPVTNQVTPMLDWENLPTNGKVTIKNGFTAKQHVTRADEDVYTIPTVQTNFYDDPSSGSMASNCVFTPDGFATLKDEEGNDVEYPQYLVNGLCGIHESSNDYYTMSQVTVLYDEYWDALWLPLGQNLGHFDNKAGASGDIIVGMIDWDNGGVWTFSGLMYCPFNDATGAFDMQWATDYELENEDGTSETVDGTFVPCFVVIDGFGTESSSVKGFFSYCYAPCVNYLPNARFEFDVTMDQNAEGDKSGFVYTPYAFDMYCKVTNDYVELPFMIYSGVGSPCKLNLYRDENFAEFNQAIPMRSGSESTDWFYLCSMEYANNILQSMGTILEPTFNEDYTLFSWNDWMVYNPSTNGFFGESSYGRLNLDASGLDKVVVDNLDAPIEFFNLQGMKIENPTAGQVYIRRKGSDVKKIVL